MTRQRASPGLYLDFPGYLGPQCSIQKSLIALNPQTNACLLNMRVYGLFQSAYLWVPEINGTLLAFGMTQSRHDDSFNYDSEKRSDITVYVDDIDAFLPNSKKISEFTTYLEIQSQRPRNSPMVTIFTQAD